jgi:hypothetical protein
MKIAEYIESLLKLEYDSYVQFISKHPTKGYRGHISRDLESLEAWAIKENQNGRDIYYTLCAYSDLVKTARPSDSHPNKWKVRRNEHTAIPRDFIFLDFDFKDQQLPEWQSDPHAVADTIIAELGEPSAQVHTGGGVHLYYHLKSPKLVLSAQMELRGLFNPQQTEFPIIDDRAGRALHDLARLPHLTNHKRKTQVELITLTDKADVKRHSQLTDKVKFVSGAVGPMAIRSNTAFSGKRPPVCNLKRFYVPVARIGEIMVTLREVKDACGAFRQFVTDAKNSFKRGSQKVGTHDDLLTACSIVKFSVTKSGIQEVDTQEQLKRAKTLCMRHPDAEEVYIEQQYHSVNYRRGCDTWSASYSQFCDNCPYAAEVKRKNKQKTATPYGAAVSLKNAQTVVANNQALNKKLSKVVNTPDQLKFVEVPPMFIVDDKNGIFFNDGNKRSGQITAQPFRIGKVAHPNKITIYLGPDYLIPIPMNISARSISMLEHLQEQGIAAIPSPDVKEATNAQHHLTTFVRASHAMCHIIPRDDQGYGWRKSGRNFLFSDRTLVLENNRTVEKPPAPDKISNAHCYQLAEGCDAVAWWQSANSLFFDIDDMYERSAAVMAAFASPLYSILLHNRESHGHIYVLVGTGNIGKSTALFAAQSVWGLADRPMISPSSTVNAVYARLTVNGVLPACYDDILRPLADNSNSRSTPLAHLAHYITEGRARERLVGANYSLSEDIGFSQILIATANSSMVTRLNQETDEELALTDRITEAHVGDVSNLVEVRTGSDVAQLTETNMHIMRINAGSAGREYIAYLMPRIERYKTTYRMFNDSLLTMKMRNRHERTFWACLLTAQEIVFDMGRLKNKFLKVENIVDRVTDYRTGVKKFIVDKEITPEEIIAANHKNIYWCELHGKGLELSAGYSEHNSRIADDRAIWRYTTPSYEYFFITKYAIKSYIRANDTNTSVGALISKWERDNLIEQKRCRLPTPVGATIRKRILVYKRKSMVVRNVPK